MPEVRVSKEVHVRIKEFKQIVEAVIGEEIGLDTCAELILGQGMDAMLAEIIGSVDKTTLLKSFQQLSSQFPSEIYGYVAETLRTGVATQLKEEIRQRIGFAANEDSKTQEANLPIDPAEFHERSK
ncbi:MAG TPA: hypothetical protein VK699_13060 [Terriglobales bacterium]|jgi:hypothetical protein|nr:hypothetical protein [Terriglobales bacterium]